MAASAWRTYYSFPLELGKETHDFANDTLKMSLVTSTSNFATLTIENLNIEFHPEEAYWVAEFTIVTLYQYQEG